MYLGRQYRSNTVMFLCKKTAVKFRIHSPVLSTPFINIMRLKPEGKESDKPGLRPGIKFCVFSHDVNDDIRIWSYHSYYYEKVILTKYMPSEANK